MLHLILHVQRQDTQCLIQEFMLAVALVDQVVIKIQEVVDRVGTVLLQEYHNLKVMLEKLILVVEQELDKEMQLVDQVVPE